MNYPHSLTIERPGTQGSLNNNTGKFTPVGEPITVYDGLVDAQEIGSEGLKYQGKELDSIDVVLDVFIKDETLITSFKVGDKGTITRRGFTNQLYVMQVRVLDGTLRCVVSGGFEAVPEQTFSLLMESGERVLIESGDLILLS